MIAGADVLCGALVRLTAKAVVPVAAPSGVAKIVYVPSTGSVVEIVPPLVPKYCAETSVDPSGFLIETSMLQQLEAPISTPLSTTLTDWPAEPWNVAFISWPGIVTASVSGDPATVSDP